MLGVRCGIVGEANNVREIGQKKWLQGYFVGHCSFRVKFGVFYLFNWENNSGFGIAERKANFIVKFIAELAL